MTPAPPAHDGAAASHPDPAVDHDDDAASRWGDADDATHVDAAHNPVRVQGAVEPRPRTAARPPARSSACGVFGGSTCSTRSPGSLSASLLTSRARGPRRLRVRGHARSSRSSRRPSGSPPRSGSGRRSSTRTRLLWLLRRRRRALPVAVHHDQELRVSAESPRGPARRHASARPSCLGRRRRCACRLHDVCRPSATSSEITQKSSPTSTRSSHEDGGDSLETSTPWLVARPRRPDRAGRVRRGRLVSRGSAAVRTVVVFVAALCAVSALWFTLQLFVGLTLPSAPDRARTRRLVAAPPRCRRCGSPQGRPRS